MISPETVRWGSPLAAVRPYRRLRGRPFGSKNRNKRLLTRRMEQAIGLITLGLSNREIAAFLGLTYRTVTTLVNRTMQRLGVHSRLEIAVHVWKVAA